jgi:hypothetical protein
MACTNQSDVNTPGCLIYATPAALVKAPISTSFARVNVCWLKSGSIVSSQAHSMIQMDRTFRSLSFLLSSKASVLCSDNNWCTRQFGKRCRARCMRSIPWSANLQTSNDNPAIVGQVDCIPIRIRLSVRESTTISSGRHVVIETLCSIS